MTVNPHPAGQEAVLDGIRGWRRRDGSRLGTLDGAGRLDGLALLAQEGRLDGLGLGALAVRALGTDRRSGRNLTDLAGGRGRRAGPAPDRDLAGVPAVVAGGS